METPDNVALKRVLREARAWYLELEPKHRLLTEHLHTTLRNILTVPRIPHDHITARPKTLESFLDKVQRHLEGNADYDYHEVNDLSGARVVVLVPDQFPAIQSVFMELFNEIRCEDKSKELGSDRLGYRALHYDARLNDKFTRQNHLTGLRFEVQLHTLLGHAWTQLSTNRFYKLPTLSGQLDRRFRLMAGLLEYADLEFQYLVRAVDTKRSSAASQGTLKRPQAKTLDGPTLESFVQSRLASSHPRVSFRTSAETKDILVELRKFGIRTTEQLSDVIPDAGAVFTGTRGYVSIGGVLRMFMVRNDVQRYYTKAWKQYSWRLTHQQWEMLREDGVDVGKVPKWARPLVASLDVKWSGP